tara:strand:+ start:211 stop:459 length:249 start_codon:yes stop_codon:yes gene_type:complete
MTYIDLNGPRGNAINLWGIAIDLAKQTETKIFGFDPKYQQNCIYDKFKTMPYEGTVSFMRENFSNLITLTGDDYDDWEDDHE